MSCSSNSYGEKKIYHKYVKDIQSNYSKSAKEKFGLRTQGTGSSMCDGVSNLAMAFDLDIKEGLNVDEVRKLYIKSSEAFLEKINGDVKLKPYLKSYPFRI